MYKATLKATIDTDGIYAWLKRDDKEKVTIIQQNDSLQDAIQKNDELIEDLKEKYNRATSQAEKDSIREQMNDADREFLANQKFEEGNKLYYANDYDEAIKLYDEVLKFGEYSDAYYNRGCAYSDLGQYERAIQDYNKAIQINPNIYQTYGNRGEAYYYLKNYNQAFEDLNKSIELGASGKDLGEALYYRGLCYQATGDKAKAQADFAKAKELGYEG